MVQEELQVWLPRQKGWQETDFLPIPISTISNQVRTYRYRCYYRWNNVMDCDFEFNAVSIKQARLEAKEFAEVNERIRGISCKITKVCKA